MSALRFLEGWWEESKHKKMATGSPTRNSDTNSSSIVGRKKLESGILWKVHVGLVLVQVGYGMSCVLIKIALTDGVNPIVLGVYRDFVCLIVLSPIAFRAERRKRTPFTFESFMLIFGCGFFGPFLTQILALYGVLWTSVAYTSTLLVLVPVYTLIISTSCGWEQIRWTKRDGQAKVGGCICALFGAVVLALYFGPVVLGHLNSGVHTTPLSEPDTSGLLAPTLLYFNIGHWQLGIICLLVSAFTISLTYSFQAPLLTRYPAPISAASYSYLVGSSLLFTTALFTVKDWSDLIITERSAVISYVYNGLVSGAFNYTTVAWCIHKAGAVLVGSYIPLQLFTAVAFSYLFLGESIHLGSLFGALLIISGVGLITWGQANGRNEDGLPIKSALPIDGMLIATAGPSLEEPLLG